VGDVLFSHPKMVHSAGHHVTPGFVRLAAVCDFQRIRPRGHLWWQVDGATTAHHPEIGAVAPDGRVPFPTGTDLLQAGEASAKLIWHHDVLEMAPPASRPSDMWQGWNLGALPVKGGVVDEPSWPARWGVSAHPPVARLKDVATLDERGWKVQATPPLHFSP
jgi:hypothetical protein